MKMKNWFKKILGFFKPSKSKKSKDYLTEIKTLLDGANESKIFNCDVESWDVSSAAQIRMYGPTQLDILEKRDVVILNNWNTEEKTDLSNFKGGDQPRFEELMDYNYSKNDQE